MLENVWPSRPSFWIRPKQFLTEMAQLVRHACANGAWVPWLEPLFLGHHAKKATCEGRPPSQCFIKHDAHAIPIARLRSAFSSTLFRGHIERRSGNPAALSGFAAGEINGQPEVEQHHAPITCNQHIGGFDVSMQHAAFMQRADSFSKLCKSRPQAACHRLWNGRLARKRGNPGCNCDPFTW